MAKNSYQNLIIFAICLHGRNILFPHGIEQCFLMLVISNILSLATIARLFLRFPAQKNDNMADSSRETSASSKKKKKKKGYWQTRKKSSLLLATKKGNVYGTSPARNTGMESKSRWYWPVLMRRWDNLKDYKAKWKVLRSQFMREVLHYNNHNIDFNIGVVAIVECSRKFCRPVSSPLSKVRVNLKVRMHQRCFTKQVSSFSQFGERHVFSCFATR